MKRLLVKIIEVISFVKSNCSYREKKYYINDDNNHNHNHYH